MKILMVLISFVLILLLAQNGRANGCDALPHGLIFVGHTGEGWKTFAVIQESGKLVELSLRGEVRHPSLSLAEQTILYIDESGDFRKTSLKDGKERIVASFSPERGFAQPVNGSTESYVVELKQGKSVDTDILRIDENGTITPAVIQRSAQFEPFLAKPWLYFSNVHCVVGCGKIIQEIWRYHTVGGEAEQVTLMNAISRQPHINAKQEWLYFSSNASGNFHIYRQSLTTRSVERLTKGAVTDSDPATAGDKLYFIRSTSKGASLMCLDDASTTPRMVSLPATIKNLRDLEIVR